jgi:hypothetical protein
MARPEKLERESAPQVAVHGADLASDRFRWRVRDCVFSSWRPLRETYSIAEMWQLLRQGKFANAVRISNADER